jgi:hypothetical protein
MTKYIYSLTTIPSRINNIDDTIVSLLNQTKKSDKIILNVPKNYNFRFANTNIDMASIKKKYSNNIIINELDNDYGPGTKLLGLFENSILENENTDDTFIILVDDDQIYRNYMIEYFNNYNEKYYKNNLSVASFYCHEFNKVKIGQGADGFFIKLNVLKEFKRYYDIIKNYDFVNYHDDLYISYYMYLKNINIEYIIPPYNKLIRIDNNITSNDALVSISGKYNRANLNYEICLILNTIKNKGEFDFI